MQTSIYGLGGFPFRLVFWVGVFVGICLQYWLPSLGDLIAVVFKYIVLILASIVQ